MSFDFSTLITDRTQADVSYAKALAAKISAGTASEAEIAEFNGAALRGVYSYTDLNRVAAAMEDLKAKLEGYGYSVPGYQRIKVPHVVPEPAPTSRLPEGYLELAWIESTGAQYVDTGVVGSVPLKIELDIGTFTGTSTVDKMVMASTDGTNSTVPVYFYNGTWFAEVGKTGGQSASGTLKDNTRHNVVFNATSAKYSLVVNNATLIEKTGSLTGSTKPLFLFARNNNGTASHHATAKVYGLKMYSNGVLVRDYVPCVNPSGDVGLFDSVEQKFYGNAGTGVFKSNLDFSSCDWDYVVEACKENKIPSFWNVGDQKTMTINGSEYMVDIIGMGHDIYSDGSGVAPITLQLHDCYATKYPMNSSGTNSGGWKSSVLRTNTLPSILELMPSVVRGAIKEVDKLSSAGSQSATIVTTADKLFLLSEVELFGSLSYSHSGEGNQYAYYKNGGSKIKKVGGSADHWWERSPYSGNTASFCMVYNTGAANTNTASYSRGVSFAFCFACNPSVEQASAYSRETETNTEEYDIYTWYEFDYPTPETMTLYLLNVAAIRSVLAVLKSTPKVPVDAVDFMTQDANDIETILLDVYAQLLIMPTTFVACGEALCGGDNL